MTITTAEKVAAWCNREATDPTLVEAWNAAEDYVSSRVSWVEPDPETGELPDPLPAAPAALVQAVNLLTARYLARRSSPQGLASLGDLGAVQVAFTDVDVERLLNPWRDIAVA